MKTNTTWLCAVALALFPATTRAQRACVEGITLNEGTFDANTIEDMARFGATCVRVRLRRDRWTGVSDDTRLGEPSRTLWEAWDALLGLYRARQIEVYLEVGADALGRRPHELRDPSVRAQYVELFARVVGRYARTVKVFELPDRWDEPPPAGVAGETALPPEDVARLALEAREAADREVGSDACRRYELLLGGVRYNQSPGNAGTLGRWLGAVYAAGLGPDGRGPGLWDARKVLTGTLPFDGIAVRSYPVWNPLLTASDQGAQAASSAASAAGDVLARYEGGRTARSVWITEAGFASDGTAAQNTRQRDWMASLFREAARDDISTPIRMTSWYAYVDPPWEPGGWGVAGDGVTRPAFDVLYSALRRSRPQRYMRLVWTVPTLYLRPSERRVVEVRAFNLGPDDNGRGTIPMSERVRFCAAPGCPITEDTNELRWTEPPPRGNGDPSPTGACVEFALTRDWWAGVSELFRWEITAPEAPGRYTLSTRMRTVDGVWLGLGSSATVVVSAPDAGADVATPDSAPDSAPDVAALDAAADGVVSRDVTPMIDASLALPSSRGCACRAGAPSPRSDARGLLLGLLTLVGVIRKNRPRR